MTVSVKSLIQSQKVIEVSTAPATYAEHLARALVTYGDHDPVFHQQLKVMVEAAALPAMEVHQALHQQEQAPVSISLLWPLDREQALHRAAWLIEAVTHNRLDGSLRAAAILKTVSRPEHTPSAARQLIVGLVGIAIPGITMGLLRRPPRILSVVRKDLLKADAISITQGTNAVVSSLLVQELALAHGYTHHLQPEFGEWLFGERGLMLATATEQVIADMQLKLSLLGIPVALKTQDDRAAYLAVSPAIGDAAAFAEWPLTSLNES